jgi:hypothetical protein
MTRHAKESGTRLPERPGARSWAIHGGGSNGRRAIISRASRALSSSLLGLIGGV